MNICSVLKIVFIGFVCGSMGCKKQVGISPDGETIDLTTSKNTLATTTKKSAGDFAVLEKGMVGLMVLDDKHKDPYQRLGWDAAAACYSCDIAAFRLDPTRNQLYVLGNCMLGMAFSEETKNNFQVLEIQQISLGQDKSIDIALEDHQHLTFSKVMGMPLYQIQKSGTMKSKIGPYRIMEYATAKANLHAFDMADCGDFGG